MSVTYVTLDTENERVKWFKRMIHNLERDSTFAMLQGRGKGQGTIVREEGQKAGNTFYVEAIGVASGAPSGYDQVLVDYASSLNFSANTGYRGAYGFAIAARRFTQAATPRVFYPESVLALRKHWARVNDAIAVNAASAYNISVADPTTVTLATVYDTSVAANITGLAAILNVQYIGHADAATSKGVNAFFAGDDDGPRIRPETSRWADAVANPEAYLIDEQSLAWLYSYAWSRGIPPVDLDQNFLSRPPYFVLLPSAAIDEMRAGAAYRNAVLSGDISSAEMWTGKMRFESIHGNILIPFDNPYPFDVSGVTNGTLLRNTNADPDTRYMVVEGLLLGGQAVAVDEYDTDFRIRVANEDDMQRTPKIGYDIIKGAVGIQRVNTNTTTPVRYNNYASFIFTMRRWG